MQFYLNNSSTKYLGCTLRYKRIVVDGCKLPRKSKPELLGGSLFHAMMAEVDDRHDFNYFTIVKKPVHWDEVNGNLAVRYAMLADKIYTDHKDWFVDCRREQVCEFPVTEIEVTNENGEKIGVAVHYNFTPDLMYYDAEDDCVVIRDYKTTGKPINGDLFIKYALESQPFFYQLGLIWASIIEGNPLNLPEHWIKAIKNERVKFGYVFVNATVGESGQVVVQPLRFVDTNVLKRYRQDLSEKMQLAATLHVKPELASKEGIFTDACTYCEFRSICAMNDPEREEMAMKHWPLGFKTYDPRIKEL